MNTIWLKGKPPSAGSPYVWYHNGHHFFSAARYRASPSTSSAWTLQASVCSDGSWNRLDNIFDMIWQVSHVKTVNPTAKVYNHHHHIFSAASAKQAFTNPSSNPARAGAICKTKHRTYTTSDFSPWNLVNKSPNAHKIWCPSSQFSGPWWICRCVNVVGLVGRDDA